jgi:hypothetical protein
MLLVFVGLVLSFTANAQNGKPQPLTQEEFEALCPTPPMGWNSWNKFGCNVSEQLLMEAADAMVASGRTQDTNTLSWMTAGKLTAMRTATSSATPSVSHTA